MSIVALAAWSNTKAAGPPSVGLGANLITNGSFESGSTGWTGNANVEIGPVSNYGVPAAPQGTRVVEVEGDVLSPNTTAAYLQQTVTTVVGRTYLFSVQAVTRVNANTADRGHLTVAGVNVLDFATTSTWAVYQVSFTASSTSVIVGIYSDGSATGYVQPGDGVGLILDLVSVVPVDHYTTYAENAAGTALASTSTVLADADGPNMASASLTLTNPQTGDRLLVNGSAGSSGTLASGIAWTRTNTQVNMGGSYTKAQYAAALRLVQFNSTSDAPNTSVVRQVDATVNDGTAVSNTARTYIAVTAVNDAPVADDDTFSINKGQTIAAGPIRDNDRDVDNGAPQLTWSLVDGGTAAANGTLVVNANGSFNYTPPAQFLGTVSFTYRVCDGGPLCDPATVTIMVSSALPVELLSFTGRNEGVVNLLEWATASQSGCERFEVERSTDAVLFTKIGALPGAGDSQGLRTYSFVDQGPPAGVAYYRLRQVDTDDAYEYSPIIPLVRTSADDLRRVILLDPAGLFALDRALGDDAQAELLNEQGAMVAGRILAGSGRCTIDLRGLPAGMYIARVTEHGHVQGYKLMTQY